MGEGSGRGSGRVGSDFSSAIAGRVGSTFRRVGSEKLTRGRLSMQGAPEWGVIDTPLHGSANTPCHQISIPDYRS